MVKVKYMGVMFTLNVVEFIRARQESTKYGGKIVLERKSELNDKKVNTLKIEFPDAEARRKWENYVRDNSYYTRLEYIGEVKICSYDYKTIIEEAKNLLPDNGSSIGELASENGFFLNTRFNDPKSREDWEAKMGKIEETLNERDMSSQGNFGKIYFPDNIEES